MPSTQETELTVDVAENLTIHTMVPSAETVKFTD